MNNHTAGAVMCSFFVLCVLAALPLSAQSFMTLASFNGIDGSDPYSSPVVQGLDGNFYGTTAYGGTNCSPSGCGTIFKITPAGVLYTLYNFCSQDYCTDGAYPFSGLVLATDGNFYGTTSQGGNDFHSGTVFRITPAGQLTILYNFCSQANCTDGSYPTGSLLQAADGNFYGSTFTGGLNDAQYCNGGCGTLFKITLQGSLTLLHSFAGYNLEGSGPSGNLLQGKNGNFYGTTSGGGAFNSCNLGCGTVFELTSTGALKTLHSFSGPPGDGQAPKAGLVIGKNGFFYGTTSAGGSTSNGTLFNITPAGTLSTLYDFVLRQTARMESNPNRPCSPVRMGISTGRRHAEASMVWVRSSKLLPRAE